MNVVDLALPSREKYQPRFPKPYPRGVNSEDIWKFSGRKKMKHGNHGKKLFIVAIAFFWSVLVLKKSQKNYFGGRFSPTPVVGMWCPALYILSAGHPLFQFEFAYGTYSRDREWALGERAKYQVRLRVPTCSPLQSLFPVYFRGSPSLLKNASPFSIL